jgi:hypothetical protein
MVLVVEQKQKKIKSQLHFLLILPTKNRINENNAHNMKNIVRNENYTLLF